MDALVLYKIEEAAYSFLSHDLKESVSSQNNGVFT